MMTWRGYLAAHRNRRVFFKTMGARSTAHGHPTAQTTDLSDKECAALFAKALRGKATAADAQAFRGQMLTEMAKMSLEDGLVMQIHPGSFRNHNPQVRRDSVFPRARAAGRALPDPQARSAMVVL
jgi:glucuronate isomerase